MFFDYVGRARDEPGLAGPESAAVVEFLKQAIEAGLRLTKALKGLIPRELIDRAKTAVKEAGQVSGENEEWEFSESTTGESEEVSGEE